jgi:putative ABC transport system permease protein
MTRLYVLALHVLPAEMRSRHGAQMAAVFGDLAREARQRQGPAGALRALLAELGALLWLAWCERRGAPLPRRIDERMLAWPAQEEGKSQMLSSVAQDVRFAARMLARTPGFTLVATVTIALAIGANTAIFSVVNAVLLKPLPYAAPERLVILGNHTDGGASLDSTTPGNFYDWQRGATGFESMAAFAYTERVLTWDGNADRVLGALSAGSVFDVLGRRAAVGRTFGAAEDRPGGERVVVLGHGLAVRLFGGPSSAVGKVFGLGGEPFTVIGVMPPDFRFPDYDAEFWVPARYDQAFRENRDQYSLQAVARLSPGTTLTQARAQLATVMDAIRREHPQFTANATAGAVPMKEWLVNGVRTRVVTVMGAVAFILLIACANLGNLLLARATTRRREMAVRHALGARPLRLARQLLTESVLLSALGGAAGLAVGAALLKILVAFMPDDMPRADGIAMDPAVLGFSVAVSLASGLAFGLFPALQLALRAPLEAVREGSRGSGRTGWVRSGLVTSEVALALVLLAGAGLLVRSFEKLVAVPHGFRSDGLLTFSVSVPATVYKEPAQRAAFFDAARARLGALPGVESVAMASTLPLDGPGSGAWFNRLDRPVPADQTPPAVRYRVVSPDYFRALGIPLLRGRELTEHDRLDGARAVVITESAARRFWPGGDPLGSHIFLGAPDNRLFPDAEVVGIVADVKQRGPGDARTEAVFVPHRMMPGCAGFSFALRTTGDPYGLAAAARAEVRGIDPDVPVTRMRTMDEVFARSVASPRSSAVLLALLAALAVTLAVIGVFGVLSYSVAQQTTELGIRLALGATARQVALLVLARGMRPVLLGVACGLAGALALGRFVESLLFGVAPGDPLTFAAVAGVLTVVAAVASYLPARAATRVDPALVLRQS